jgi:hypothetical protein
VRLLIIGTEPGNEGRVRLADDHKTFLGCLNCGNVDKTSICNAFSHYGSKYSAESIWNDLGQFGSVFGAYSPWNTSCGSPPIIVDDSGATYGYFTISTFHHDRTKIDRLVEVLDFFSETKDLERTRDKLCGH